MSDPKPAKSDLFAAYRAKAKEVAAAKAATLEIEKEASVVIAEIVKHYGAGPYKLDGALVKARKAKDSLGGLFSFNSQDITGEEV